MAFEAMMLMTYRIVCDSCGSKALEWASTHEGAIQLGKKAGFVECLTVSGEFHQHRWLCHGCAELPAAIVKEASE